MPCAAVAEHQCVFFGVEARIETVSWRGRCKTRRDSEAALRIQSNDHSGIIPPALGDNLTGGQ